MPPLSGLIVISMDQAVAAPSSAGQLAEQGSHVIKIERPGEGDFARSYNQTVHGQLAYCVWLNRSNDRATVY